MDPLGDRTGFGTCTIDFTEGSEVVRFREVPANARPRAHKDDLRFLAPGKALAYAMFLLKADVGACAARDIAFAAFMVAENEHLYRYLKSTSSVFSSQDVAQYLQNPEKFNPLLVSGDLLFYLSRIPDPPWSDIGDVHLHYAVEAKKFSFLPSGEAIKYAMLSVCRLVGYRMHCVPLSDPTADLLLAEELELGPGKFVVYDPAEPIVAARTTLSRG